MNLLEEQKQIATQTFYILTILDLNCEHTKSIPNSGNMKLDFFHSLTILDLNCEHTKSIPKSGNMKLDFFHSLSFEGILPPQTYV